jgi:hypothetical protein
VNRPPDGAGPRGRRPALRRAVALGLALVASGPSVAAAAELSATGSYLLEPQIVDNLDLDGADRDDRRLSFIGQQFRTALSLRSGTVHAAIGLELADGLAGRQSIADPANPRDDVTTLQVSPDTGESPIDFFWARWDMALGVLRAGWFKVDLDSYRLFVGRRGAPALQLDVPLGVFTLQYTMQKVAERTGISTAPSPGGPPAVPAPRSTLLGTGDVDAHYLRLELKNQDLGPLDIRRIAVWGVHAADRRPEDAARLLVAGGTLHLRLGPAALYGEANFLTGEYEGSSPVTLTRGPGTADDELLVAGSPLRGHVAFAGVAVDIGEQVAALPLVVGVEAVRGSGDRSAADGRAGDTTSLRLVHENLDGEFELSRLFGTFVLAEHGEYFKTVDNLTAVKPFLVASIGRQLKLGAAAYRLATTRPVAVTRGGTATGEWSQDLGWQYEASAGWTFASGVTASLLYTYLEPGPALRPGGDPAQTLYTSLRFRF